MVGARIAQREQAGQGTGRGEPLVDHDGGLGQGLDDAQHCQVRGDRRRLGRLERPGTLALAVRRPVAIRERVERGAGPIGAPRVDARLEPGDERAQGLARVRAQRHLGRVVLAHLPVALAQLDDRHTVGQGLGLGVHRHAQHVGADADQQIMGCQGLSHLHLVPGQGTHESGMLAGEVGAIGGGLLKHRCTQGAGKGGRLFEAALGGHLVTGDA